MKYAIISDIHANLTALELTLKSIDASGAGEKICCLGDIVGFHTSPGECIDLLQERGITCIAGNHDAGVVGKLAAEKLPRECWEAIEWTRRKLSPRQLDFLRSLPNQMVIGKEFWLMHGIFNDVYHYMVSTLTLRYTAARLRMAGIPLAFFGHTHTRKCHEFPRGSFVFAYHDHHAEGEISLNENFTYLVNPGTVGHPRTRDTGARYCILDTERRTVLFVRIPYDYGAVVQRTLAVFPGHRASYARFAEAPAQEVQR
ncbi:MAG: metallophosphoesterase family protein [Bacteroidota bacterium]